MSLSTRVAERVKAAQPSTVLADIVAAPFYALGWVVFWVLVVIGGVWRWSMAAIALGWFEAREQATRREVGTNRWPVRARVRRAHGPS